MSREIKFRGKHIHAIPENKHLDGTWVYGYLVDRDYINSPELEGELFIDENTVGQYTGLKDNSDCLLDTDKEKEVYEDDIVTVSNDKITVTGIIKYDLGSFIIVTNDISDGWTPLINFVEFDGVYQWINGVVIGNIHDNKDLLNGGKGI